MQDERKVLTSEELYTESDFKDLERYLPCICPEMKKVIAVARAQAAKLAVAEKALILACKELRYTVNDGELEYLQRTLDFYKTAAIMEIEAEQAAAELSAYRCRACGARFDKPATCEAHDETDHSEQSEKFQGCPECKSEEIEEGK